MTQGKKIIYTDSAKERLGKFHFEVSKEMESYFRERKYVPGDDFIEITALDIDEVAQKFRIIRSSSSRSMRTLIPLVYSIIGFGLLIGGLFYNQILQLLRGDPQRLILIGAGLTMIVLSWSYLYLVRNKEKRNENSKLILADKQEPVDNDKIEITNIDRVIGNKNIIVNSAKYFFERNYLNVTSKIKELTDNNIFEFTVNNDLMGGDPAYGKIKILEIEYSINGVTKTISSPEGTTVKIE